MMTLSRNRTALQWTLGTLAVIPMASAVGEILHGPRGVPGGSPDVAPTVDSSLRYANVFKFASGVTVLRELRRIERSSATSFALSTIAVGGLALGAWILSVGWFGFNVMSAQTLDKVSGLVALNSLMAMVGGTHPVIVGAIALQTIGAPLLLTWQRRISAKAV